MSIEGKDYINQVPLDLRTGLCVYKGQQYTYQELIDLWEEEKFDEQDELSKLRDYTRDDQNLWGSKSKFHDDWYRRKKPFRKRKGYPRDCEDNQIQ